jgi:glutathione peroxidase
MSVLGRTLCLSVLVSVAGCSQKPDGPAADTSGSGSGSVEASGEASGSGGTEASGATEASGSGATGTVDGSGTEASGDTGAGSGSGTITEVEHMDGRIDHTVKRLDGTATSLHDYRGKVMLVVNVASECGFTPQYEELQALYAAYEARGLKVLGFPANEFGSQEPGTSEEIATFCSSRYGVTFDMFEKIVVKGVKIAPLYRTLTTESPAAFQGDIPWNFTKFLVDKNGFVINRFAPTTTPMSAEVTAAIEAALTAP